ncbi:hypothetical protein [Parahaliea mediterranea]|uniref:Uncharacterized protein n=1 Tax=Parahaliea mediterranea TaxID=651086 RepID=A0A939DEN2_9GAMM|nr:hypothetical protein [Parahaliea mediterranea]MBN7796132.1 hypothetical protein [Parahaliea mediterranea]
MKEARHRNSEHCSQSRDADRDHQKYRMRAASLPPSLERAFYGKKNEFAEKNAMKVVAGDPPSQASCDLRAVWIFKNPDTTATETGLGGIAPSGVILPRPGNEDPHIPCKPRQSHSAYFP